MCREEQDHHACASKELGFPAGCVAGRKAENAMIERKLTLAEIMLIAGTRVALGVGIGLLLSSKLTSDQRKAVGVALTLVGGLTTVPLAMNLIGKKGATTTEIRPTA
jgi:hypothetical protein